MHIFVAGGAGYVGSKLVPALLGKGHFVTVYDLYLYGDDVFESLKDHPQLIQVKGDIRDLPNVESALDGCDAVIHLACISNDPSFELDPDLGKSINLDSFDPFVRLCKEKGIKRFIYASSSSVYGIKDESNVTEDMKLEPLTDYSRFKVECEKVLFRYMDDNFICTVLRPATVCGYAPRQRLDVIVNILTNHAYTHGKIKVTGGAQMRPNIHIKDMVRSYLLVLDTPKEKIQGETFNVGYHNHSVLGIAQRVKRIVSKKRPVDLVIEDSIDQRSYHISSDKIKRVLGFTAQYSIEDAVEDLIKAFDEGKLPNSMQDPKYFNIQTMKAVALK